MMRGIVRMSRFWLYSSRCERMNGLGFVWQRNVTPADSVIFEWADQGEFMLATDEFGFVNCPAAIEQRTQGEPVDIVAAGASFMQGANQIMYDFFSIFDMFYYNTATHRHTLPQYTIAAVEYAMPMKPRWIVYGVNEVAFGLIEDYEKWRASGKDWFSYHSGTWSGPPDRFTLCKAPGMGFCRPCQDLCFAMQRDMFGTPATSTWSDHQQLEKALSYLSAAAEEARKRGIGFVTLLIPGKQAAIYGSSPNDHLLDALGAELSRRDMRVLDLRPAFADADDPRELFYIIDGHWNKAGILLAARQLSEYLRDAP
jgi:hypothetical protein